jgi:hypothetical protein
MDAKGTEKRSTTKDEQHLGITALSCQGEMQWEYQLVDATQMSFAELHHVMSRLRSNGWGLVAVVDSTVSPEALHSPERHILLRHRVCAAMGDQEMLYAG